MELANNPLGLRIVNTTRYVTPLREGGSMPGIIEADDGFNYVLKFKGAGQGTKALIAELIGGEIARMLGFNMPELVYVNLAEGFGRLEGDEEIQDLLQGSVGLNLGLHYLSGAITFDPVATDLDLKLSSQIVWLDALLMNMDRTVRNTNMLWWHKELWLIDHGASLYWHHSWNKTDGKQPFPIVSKHVLLHKANQLDTVDAEFRPLLSEEVIDRIVNSIPDDWLDDRSFETANAQRQVYKDFLFTRVSNSQLFVKEAEDARQSLV